MVRSRDVVQAEGGADGGSPEGDWSPCRRGGGRGGLPGAGAAVERQPEARRGAAAISIDSSPMCRFAVNSLPTRAYRDRNADKNGTGDRR